MSEGVWTLGFELDVQGTYERLDHWEAGTGETFHAHVLKAIEVLRRNPFLGRIAFANRVRRILVYNRNYGMFYTIEPRGVILHALLDLRNDPGRIGDRLRQI